MISHQFVLDEAIAGCVGEHSEAPDALQRRLIEETAAMPGGSMQVAPEEGRSWGRSSRSPERGDGRLESHLLPLYDGLMVARKVAS